MNKETQRELPPDVQARIDFARSVVPKRKNNPVLRIGLLAGLVVLLILVIWLIAGGHDGAKKPVLKHESTAVYAQTSTKLRNYNSTSFGVSFSYPGNWTASTSVSGVLSIDSQLMHLTDASGHKVSGQIVIAFQKQGQLPAGFSAGTALAVLNSTLLPYTSPSTSQLAQTYVSFVQYASTNVKGGLNAIFVTGNYGYLKDEVVPATDIDNISPLISVSFNQCVNNNCAVKPEPLTIASSSWTNSTSLSQPVTNLIESLVFN